MYIFAMQLWIINRNDILFKKRFIGDVQFKQTAQGHGNIFIDNMKMLTFSSPASQNSPLVVSSLNTID